MEHFRVNLPTYHSSKSKTPFVFPARRSSGISTRNQCTSIRRANSVFTPSLPSINTSLLLTNINSDIHRRCEEIYNALPHQLHYYEKSGVPKNLTGTDLYDRANLLLQYLQNKFLIDRIALARGLDNGQSLLNTALESIDIALLYWVKRDQLMSFSCNFDWIVSFSLFKDFVRVLWLWFCLQTC
jgi:hypothetical protein